MSKLLANEIANYGDDAPIDLKEGLNIPAGKPIQAAGVSGSSGMVLSSTGSSIAWIIPFDGNYNSLTNRPTIPSAQVNSDWNATSGIAVILNKPTVPPLTSLTVNPAGTPALSFNAANGEFTYTPPDLSNYDTAYGWGDHAQAGYLTSLGDAAGVTTQKITNWDASYGWGNHASVGYLTSYSETQTLDDVLTLGASTTRDITTTGKILYSNNYANVVDLPNATTYHGMFAHVHAEGHGYFAHAGAWTQLVDTSSSIDELGDVNTATKQDGYVLKWDAASSNWKPAPDLVGTSNAGITLVDLSVQTATASSTPALSYSNTTGVFTYTPPDLSNYDTAFGWGDHAQAGYLTSETDPVFGASAAAGILSSNISNWDSAYGWGDHSVEGYATETWVGSQGFLTSIPSEIVQGNSKAEVIGSGTDDGEFKVTLQDSTYTGAGKISFRQYTSGSYNITELNPYTDGNISANSRLVLNNLTTTNAWSEIQFKLSGASSGTSTIRGNAGSSFQFYPVDGNVDFQISGAGTYTRLNHTIGGTLTAGGLTYPISNGTSGDVLTSDGTGNVTWQTPTGGGGGGANVTVSDTIPAGTPNPGDLWWESDSGRLKIYYQDVDSSQWVDTNPALAPQFGLADLSVTTASAGTAALSYNSGTGVFTYTPPDLSSFITQQYTLPTASTTVLGGVKVDGSTITINGSGVISGSSSYTLPTASTTVLGGVKVDGSTITIDGNGVISGASSVPTSITVANESTDTTCYPLFTTDRTGNLAPKTVTTLKLDSSSGQLEAGSFKKTGGTSSEFLKADGTVDSTTYSTFSGDYNNLSNRPTLVTTLGGLTDVTITGASNGQVLKYNGSAWVNDTDATGGGGGTSSIDLSQSLNKPSIYPVKIPDVNGGTINRQSFYEWYGGALASNGNIYGAPYGSNKILKIDTAAKTATTISVSGVSLNNQSYGGAVAHPNGKIYFTPMDQGNVLEFDPVTETMSTFGSNIPAYPTVTNGWSKGVVAPNGHIYCAPDGSNQVLKIDVTNRTASLFGDTGYIGILADPNQSNGDTGGSKFCGAHVVGDRIYLVPSYASDEIPAGQSSPNIKRIVGIIDTTNDTLDVTSFKFGESDLPQLDNYAGSSNNGNFSNSAITSYVFNSSVDGPDGKIYCIPYEYPWVCVIDPISNSISRMNNNYVGTVSGSGSGTVFGRTDRPGGGGGWDSDFQFYGGTLAANGKIYCNRKGGWVASPSDNKILEIDPATQSWKYISQPTTLADGSVVDSTFWFPVTVLGPDGAIYGIPYFQNYGGTGQNGGAWLQDDPLYWQPPAASLPAPWTLTINQNGVL